MDENLRYLEANFIPQNAVTRETGIAADVIQSFVDKRLLPRACYFPNAAGRLSSNLGNTTVALETAWFHPSAIPLIRDTDALLEAHVDPGALAEQRKRGFMAAYVTHLQVLNELKLVETAVWEDAFSDEGSRAVIAESEYGHWIAGTYGLCTRANTPEAVAVKECMVSNIDWLTRNGERDELPDDVREKVSRYIGLFDCVAALFAPFERSASSRQRLCVNIPARYGLDIERASA